MQPAKVTANEFQNAFGRDRRVGLAAELPEEWVEAVRNAKVPEEFAHLDRADASNAESV
jgi:hypothetical protein